ncbi:hypothetical protein G1C95_0117 [Bifidobacterium sp. DSM 109957]|uniref:Uncharacterized protein n=1 Tax=Bifidobacterium oedipodis TaxID=2675322 RepID=A0A7Y0EMK4_9BIFI|nr:hypothetical protein [Bifidobacterium sp. DSM 109957]
MMRNTLMTVVVVGAAVLMFAGGYGTSVDCTSDSAQWATPECLVQENSKADLIVVDGVAYERATDGTSVSGDEVMDKLGAVRRTGVSTSKTGVQRCCLKAPRYSLTSLRRWRCSSTPTQDMCATSKSSKAS